MNKNRIQIKSGSKYHAVIDTEHEGVGEYAVLNTFVNLQNASLYAQIKTADLMLEEILDQNEYRVSTGVGEAVEEVQTQLYKVLKKIGGI